MKTIDNKTIEQARNADIIGFFRKHCGFSFDTLRNAYRCKEHPSLAVNGDRHSWFWHSRGIGGYGPIDWLMKIDNIPFRHAVGIVSGIKLITLPKIHETMPPPTLLLPDKRGISVRLYDYLCCKRGIDGWVVSTLIHEEKLYEDKRGNVVFIGFDENQEPRFASVRGTNMGNGFRCDCAGSDKRYGFNMTAYMPSERLYLFEAPIDAMSHASIENAVTGDITAWKRDNRLSLAGTTDKAIPFFLNQHREVRELVFSLDNDQAGCEAAVLLARKYADKGYSTRIESPIGKDFNDDLAAFLAKQKQEKRTNHLHRDADILPF